MIEKNSSIKIMPMANGFAVMPDSSESMRAISDQERYVFQTMAGLIEFLQDHFTHREEFVAVDGSGN